MVNHDQLHCLAVQDTIRIEGSAIAFVSREGDVVSIDSLVVNPTYLIAGEKAEVKKSHARQR
eukprot:6209160-Pleurochrysis_carterae.AAC.1